MATIRGLSLCDANGTPLLARTTLPGTQCKAQWGGVLSMTAASGGHVRRAVRGLGARKHRPVRAVRRERTWKAAGLAGADLLDDAPPKRGSRPSCARNVNDARHGSRSPNATAWPGTRRPHTLAHVRSRSRRAFMHHRRIMHGRRKPGASQKYTLSHESWTSSNHRHWLAIAESSRN